MRSAGEIYDEAVDREFQLETSPFDVFADRRKLRSAAIAAIEAAVAEERGRCLAITRRVGGIGRTYELTKRVIAETIERGGEPDAG